MNSASCQSQPLCLECGLCCNGTIFADVRLNQGDELKFLVSQGLRVKSAPGGRPRLLQPCDALEGRRCRIYERRPGCCREFECLLLKSVNNGKTTLEAAHKIVHSTRQCAGRVEKLLEDLGDTDQTVSLSQRFRRTSRRIEQAPLDESTASMFAELSLAVHDLNLLLGEAFYPQPS